MQTFAKRVNLDIEFEKTDKKWQLNRNSCHVFMARSVIGSFQKSNKIMINTA